MKVLADGSLLFDTKVDTSGLKNALSGVGGIASSAFGIASKAVAAVSAGLGAGAAASVKFGSEFETSFAKASTLFGDVAVDTDNLNKKILEMSNSSGVAASDLNETLYQAMSAGIPVTEDMAEALNAVEVANKLAVGGYTSSATAMSGLTTAINAYGLNAEEASRIADEFITVQNKGVTSVDELASNMGKAIATGSAYGVNLENLNASYISLTKSGINTAESTTYLSSMINELGDSGSGASQILQDVAGMSFPEMMNSGASLADVLDILLESVDGDTSALMNMWGSAEAGKAANAILSQGTDTFRQSLDDLANSTGATETAYNTMMDTFEGKKSILTENAKNLGISIYEGMKDQASGMLDIANDYIAQLQAGFEENGTEGLIAALGSVIADLVGRAADLAPQIIELAIEIVRQLGQALVDSAPEILSSVQEIINTVLESIGELCPAISPITDALQSLLGDIESLVPYVEAAVGAFIAFKTAMAIGSLVAGIVTLISGMSAAYTAAAAAEEGLTVAQWLLNAAMSANPIGIIVTLIAVLVAALVAAFILLWNKSEAFREFWLNLWDNICGFFSDIWNNIINFFTQTIPNFISNIGIWFSELPDKISYWLGFALGKAVTWAVQLPHKATEAGKNFVSNVIDFVKNLPSKFWDWLVKTAVKITKWKTDLKKKGKEAIDSMKESIMDAAKELPEKLSEIGKNIVSGVWNGICNAKEQFFKNVKSFFSGLVDGAKSELDINSPSKKFAWIGKMCVEGFEQPLEKYNPYDTLSASMKANKSTLKMNYQAGAEAYMREEMFDYSEFGKETVEAFVKAGLTVSIDKRPFGRIVRGVTV